MINPHRPGSRRLIQAGVVFTAAAALVGLALPGSAYAAASAPPAAHCVVDVTRVAPALCYATFTAAISAATGGRVTDAPVTAVAALADSGLEAKVNAAAARAVGAATPQIVLSVDYDLIDFDGSTLTSVGNNLCSASTADFDYAAADYNVTRPAWVNRISAFRTYAGCRTIHYEDPNFRGALIGPSTTDSYIGAAMDNRTSSQRWT